MPCLDITQYASDIISRLVQVIFISTLVELVIR